MTYQEAPGEKPVSLAQRAHLVGVGRQGPRSRETPLSDDPNAVENLTLFCGVHHPIVDNNPRIYSVEVLAKYKADHEARMAPTEVAMPVTTATEPADLSLLPVSALPSEVWTATARFRTTEEVREHLPRPRRNQVLPFVLIGGKVWTFYELADRRGPFRDTVELATAERRSAADVLRTDRKVYVWLLNAALRHALLRRGIRHRPQPRPLLLPGHHETVTRRVEAKTKTGRKQSAQEGRSPRRRAQRQYPRSLVAPCGTASLRRVLPRGVGADCPARVPPYQGWPRAPRSPAGRTQSHPTQVTNVQRGVLRRGHFFRHFLLDGRPRLTLEVGAEQITIEGDFPTVSATWAQIDDKRFDPVATLDSDDEDDLLDAVAEALPDDEDDWQWGAEHVEDDR